MSGLQEVFSETGLPALPFLGNGGDKVRLLLCRYYNSGQGSDSSRGANWEMRHWWEMIRKERASITTQLSDVHGVLVLRVSDNIVLGTTEPQFRAALKKAVEEEERTEGTRRVLVVDFSELNFLDSIGLSTLMHETEELRKRGGEVRLVIPPGGRLGHVLEVTGVVAMFPIYSDVPSATEERRGQPTP
jgi:anti-anti-sigma factor